jgi:hypothetical protein
MIRLKISGIRLPKLDGEMVFYLSAAAIAIATAIFIASQATPARSVFH